ncbi:TDT family transporter [Streptomyces sp. AcH 505]|uniref:SLAC1 family transporter n=1 Tax=Streptomyces sp. AcH 505 TaxID=352211 RepID=UPI000AB59096
MTATRVPLTLFGIPFGVAGLAGTWGAAASAGYVPRWPGDALIALGAVLWLAAVVLYFRGALSTKGALVADLTSGIVSPFASLMVIIPMLLAAQGIVPHALGAGRVVVDIFIVLTLLLGSWLTGQWIYGSFELDQMHPGYFLPTAAGGLIASAAASAVGQRGLAEFMLGLGVICWLMLGSLILGRLFFRPSLPAALTPTMAIEVAPGAVASLAVLALNGNRIDLPVAFLAGYGLLMVIAQIRLFPAYRKLSFGLGFWSFSFSWAAVASATMHWIALSDLAGPRVYACLVLAAITVFVAVLAAFTVRAVSRGQLLPPAPPPPPAPPARDAGAQSDR